VEAEDTTADQKIMQHVMRDYLRKKRQRGVEFRHVRKGATGRDTTGEASQASPGEPKAPESGEEPVAVAYSKP
jgi:hypothetical protein